MAPVLVPLRPLGEAIDDPPSLLVIFLGMGAE